MKGILLILTLSLFSLASAKVYYVQDPAYNENASDINPGTDINHPWATWQRGFNSAQPGDTVYFRGGTWLPRTDDYGNVTIYHPASGYGYHGTQSKPVCFFAYPPDVEQGNMPVLDCRYTHPTTNNHVGLYISTTGYVEFKGLKITNVRSWPQESGEMWCAGIMANRFNHLTLEQMTTSFIGGAGFFLMKHDTLYMINCDSHNNCDSLDVEKPGNDADGFTFGDDSPVSDASKFAYIAGCRAWNNSDDGFNIVTRKQLVMRDCWSWNNGYLEGDANGFKMSLSHLKTTWKRLVYNCIAAYNDEAGFIDLNLDEEIGPFMEYLNNTSYVCGKGFGSGPGHVFDCSRHPASVIYRNNISYAPSGPYPASFKACDFEYPTYVTQDHNTWIQTGEYFHTEANPIYSVSANDFVSMDTAQLRWPRKTDGSLPDIDFFKLSTNSDLINSGTDVGLAFFGPAPDLGAFQIGSFSVELVSPGVFKEFRKGDNIVIHAKVEGLTEEIQEVIFYTEDRERTLGSGEQIGSSLWEFTWESDALGYQDLRAVAFSSQGETATSSILKIRILWPAGDSLDLADDNVCKIVPNPNDGFFFLGLQEPLTESYDIHIISMTGQLMAVERMEQDEMIKDMDISALPPGIYKIHMVNGENPPPCTNNLKIVLN